MLHTTRPHHPHRRRLHVEQLEDRRLLSITVDTVEDVTDAGDGVTSLREAIIAANETPGLDTITFNIPGGGPHTIRPLSELPTITDPVIIDGFTQPGAQANTNPIDEGINAVLMIELDGSLAGDADGLTMTAGNSTVRGLVINRFENHGIQIAVNGDNLIAGNFIGTDVTGTTDYGNQGDGVRIDGGATNNTIGVSDEVPFDERMGNLISGNDDSGVFISGAGTAGNVVAGNYIGIDATGTNALGNCLNPVPSYSVVEAGVVIKDQAGANRVGTDGDGSSDDLERNVVSDNFCGIYIGSSPEPSSNNVVAGNFIGTDASGRIPLGNRHNGIDVSFYAVSTRIGTNGDGAADEAERNLISANAHAGVVIQGSQDTLLAGNYIGTDSTGTLPLGNSWSGVFVIDAAQHARIGGTSPGLGNTIAFNGGDGVMVAPDYTVTPSFSGDTLSIRIRGNSIHSNGDLGIDVDARPQVGYTGPPWGDGVTPNDARDVDTGANNVQNFPILSLVETGLTTHVAGMLHSIPNTTFTLDFYANSTLDPSGQQEGERYLGSIEVATDWSGNVQFDKTFDAETFAGEVVTATATDPDGNTSEFSVDAWPFLQELLTVTNTNDVGTGSLRAAINAANHLAHATIEFNIPESDPNFVDVDSTLPGGDSQADVFVIRPLTPLPAMVGWATVIDGRMQAAFGGDTNPFGPEIVLDGSLAETSTDGLQIFSNDNHVYGVNIQQFGGDGIEINGGSNNVVAACYIGSDATGMVALGNSRYGVEIVGGAKSNRIGTNGDGIGDEAERNVISGNGGRGVSISGVGSNGNRVAGNYIGTDVTGLAALSNGGEGVYILGGAQSNLIGTDGDETADEAERNVISASGQNKAGIAIGGTGVNYNVVAGNYIGTDANGTGALGNWGAGVIIFGGGKLNRVGTDGDGLADEAEGNLISGNLWDGVYLRDSGTNENIVAGNYIGTDASGLAPLGNGGIGVRVYRGAMNRIGANGDGIGDEAERNVISGNGGRGVSISGVGSNGNRVAGNYIGTDVTGLAALSNGGEGVYILGGAQSNLIGTDGDGTADEAERNVISASGQNKAGIAIGGTDVNYNVVAGNYIGTNANGTGALGNWGAGVIIFGGGKLNRVGTDGDGLADEAEGNLISGNLWDGVYLRDSGTNENIVAGNYIGTDVSGLEVLGNAGDGVRVYLGAMNRLGTNGDGIGDEAERNVISGNGGRGVSISGVGSNGNRVAGNYIGTDVSGLAALGDQAEGVFVEGGAQANLIGTDGDGSADAAERNLISGNGQAVQIFDAGTNFNVVAGNFIGTNATGTAALANGTGVSIMGGAQSNLIGTDGDGEADAAERNLISGNTYDGVVIQGANTHSNVVAGNYIGTDVSGTVALGNFRGVRVVYDAHSNLVGTNGDGIADAAERNLISGNGAREGVLIWGAGTHSNVVAGNFIGTDVTGTEPLSNGAGVRVEAGGHSNLIGTNGDGVADTAERNLVSGNAGDGVVIGHADTHSNVVAGNYIGTDVTGTVALPNRAGIRLATGAHSNRVGTNGDGEADSAERNLISGNTYDGVVISDANTNFNVVAGNFVGTDVTGTLAVGNLRGVLILWTPQFNRIGTDGGADPVADHIQYSQNERNIISGNFEDGVLIRDAGTHSNVVAGNYIGTDATGKFELGNAQNGIHLRDGAPSNVIGTDGDDVADEMERNVISANSVGVYISDAGTNENVLAGNYIGTDVTGTEALGNTTGVLILSGAQSNRIGSNGDGKGDEGERNLISGNTSAGVMIGLGGTDGNVVAGNYIGTDAEGANPLANQQGGVWIFGDSRGSPRANYIGTTGPGEASPATRNVISGNNLSGVHIQNSSGNCVSGNYIGTDAQGLNPLANTHYGVVAGSNAQSNIIGTDGDGQGDDAEGNVISANDAAGVLIGGEGASQNVVAGNYIGTDVTGSAALGNRSHGVMVLSGPDNRIGTNADGVSDEAERNLISTNDGSGVYVAGHGNQVAGNYVGTDVTGSLPLGNGGSDTRNPGVWIDSGQSNVVGGSPSEANLIAFNAGAGVAVTGETASGNRIRANAIHSNGTLGIDLGNDGFTDNDPGDADSGPNNLQNFPLINSVTCLDGRTTIEGTLHSTADTVFTLDFYANTIADPSGFDEGERFLSPTSPVVVTTNDEGDGSFIAVFPEIIPETEVITVTAADALENTSEFSRPKHGKGIADGVLHIFGTDTDDVVAITLEGTQLKIDADFIGSLNYYEVAAVNEIRVYLYHGNDTLQVAPPLNAFTTPVWVDGGTGDDSIRAGGGNDILLGGKGDDTLRGGSGNDTLYGNDGDDWLYGEDGDDALWGGGQDDHLDGGNGTDYLDGQADSDTYAHTFGSSSSTTISDSGTSGIDTLAAYGTSGPDSLLLAPGEVSAIEPAPHPIYYEGLEEVVVDAGDGNDLITVLKSHTTVLGGAGDDTFIVEGNGPDGLFLDGQDGSDMYSIRFGSLDGPVTVEDSGTEGADILTITGSDGEDVLTQMGTQITCGNQNIVFGPSVERLLVEAGKGDQFVLIEPPSVTLAVHGASDLVVHGTPGNDIIVFTPAAAGGGVLASLNGATLGTFTVSERLQAYGFDGDDEIQVAGSIGLSAWLDGGAGNDRVKGGAGHDVLLGGAGDDLLVGGSGRDLLIGGLNADRIVGNPDDDILIAGYTAYDANDEALCKIMKEWTFQDREFGVRVANLDGTGTGADYENRLNGDYFLKIDGTLPTVFDDGARDLLTGSSGIDWFIFNSDEDKATDLSDEEFAVALDFILAEV